MNLQAVLGWTRAIGLSAVFGLVACDSGEKKTEEAKVEETKTVETKTVETKTVPPPTEEKKADDVKAADPAADAKAADAVADAEKTAEAAKADAEKTAEAAKADAEKTADAAKADAKKTDAKKADAKKVEDKAPSIDGKPLYDSKCKVCHAADGKGTEAMKKNNVPDMTDKAWQGKHSKAAVAKAITEGVDGTKMKAFKDKLKPEEIDAIAAYVKKMK